MIVPKTGLTSLPMRPTALTPGVATQAGLGAGALPAQNGLGTTVHPVRAGATPPRNINPGGIAMPAKPAMPIRAGTVFRADGGEVESPTVPEVKKIHIGPIHSPVAGRTDHLPMHVPSGSYVIPADIISAMGEGNTMAGFKHMRRVFGGEPYGQGAGVYGQGAGPYGEPLAKAAGGSTPAKVRAAGILFDSPDGRILLIRRAGKDHGGEWALPGGCIEKGETPDVAARREVSEETGHDYKGPIEPVSHGVKDGVEFTTYRAHVKPFTPELNDEHDKHLWVTPEQAMKLPLHPGVRDTLEHLHSRGGAAEDGAATVPIIAAGGEYVLSPHQVRMAGGGDLQTGHRVLDEFVKRYRADTIKTLKKLPGPANG